MKHYFVLTCVVAGAAIGSATEISHRQRICNDGYLSLPIVKQGCQLWQAREGLIDGAWFGGFVGLAASLSILHVASSKELKPNTIIYLCAAFVVFQGLNSSPPKAAATAALTQQISNAVENSNKTSIKATSPELARRIQAYLMMVRYAEGTLDGYDIMFTGKRFTDFSDHPRQLQTAIVNGKPLTSDAAGAYQFLSTTWDEVAQAKGLTNFDKESQDVGAVFLLEQAGIIELLEQNKIREAIWAGADTWASLPTEAKGKSAYGQPHKELENLVQKYESYLVLPN